MINHNYLYQAKTLQKAFVLDRQFPHVTLLKCFENNFYQQVKLKIDRLKFHHQKNLCCYSQSTARIPALLTGYLNSLQFKNFISTIISKKVLSLSCHLYQFKPNDYTVRNDATIALSGVDIIIEFTTNWNIAWGGYSCYINTTGENLIIPIAANSLTIIEHYQNIPNFVKYVNHLAKNNERTFILIQLKH